MRKFSYRYHFCLVLVLLTDCRRSVTRFILGLLALVRGKAWDPSFYVVVPEKRLAYLVNSKCACSSVIQVLLEVSEGLSYREIHRLATSRQRVRWQLTADEENYFTFTFVRNPFKRLVSFYVNKFEQEKDSLIANNELAIYLRDLHRRQGTFAELVNLIAQVPPHLADRHFKPQSYLIDSVGGELDFIGRMETLGTDFAILQQRFDLPTLPVVNKSHAYNYMDYYDLATLDKVKAYYQEDLQRFGYLSIYDDIKNYLISQEEKPQT